MRSVLGRFIGAIDALAAPFLDAAPDDDERTIRRILATVYVSMSLITPLWGLTYILLSEIPSGLIPVVYGVLTFVSFGVFRRVGGWEWLRVTQLVQHLLLPFVLMWSLGGFSLSSAVLIWALLAPLSSIWAKRSTEALVVIGSFIALTAISALIDPVLREDNNIPESANIVFYTGNFVVMTTVIFLLVIYFARAQTLALEVMSRNRELETAYFQQEVSLRQSEKLATIGKLSAGLAHELNNPAAAVQQATNELSSVLVGPDRARVEVGRLGLPPDGEAALTELASRIAKRVDQPDFVDSLERSDREEEMQEMLQDAGLDNGWELAPSLVDLGIGPEDVEGLRSRLDADRLGEAITLLAHQYRRQSLLSTLDESTTRIVTMVRALKSYTHLDRAPRQLLDVHEGLDSTLVMLQNRLKTGVQVHRDYADDLPAIEGFGGELNQVWTNILDNALDAMGPEGTVRLSTRRLGDVVEVELSDSGPGIPAELLDTLFDPFVTSKPPGEGTGLGLSISHNIVTEKHGGQISVTSVPGQTTFTVRLPISPPDAPERS